MAGVQSHLEPSAKTRSEKERTSNLEFLQINTQFYFSTPKALKLIHKWTESQFFQMMKKDELKVKRDPLAYVEGWMGLTEKNNFGRVLF